MSYTEEDIAFLIKIGQITETTKEVKAKPVTDKVEE
jgi:hypothetical protein